MNLQRIIAVAQAAVGILCIGALPACVQGAGASQVGSSKGAITNDDQDEDCDDDDDQRRRLHNPTVNNDPTGVISTFSTAGRIKLNPNVNPFFASLGTNGRSCGSCHKVDQGWSISAVQIQAVFNETDGRDPMFRRVDGSNSPCADVSTEDARMEAYSLLLQRGLIRVGDGMAPPPTANYLVEPVCDPYDYTTYSPTSSCPNPLPRFSLFRRPLPSTSLKFLSEVMWDGRESQLVGGLLDKDASLQHQANDATLGHAQATTPITSEQAQAIAAFQLSIFTAQRSGQGIGKTDAQGAAGGPEYLSTLVPTLPSGPPPADTTSMTLYNAWASVSNPHRKAVARGQALFNRVVPAGRCSGCHNDINVGSRVQAGFFRDLNLADVESPDSHCTSGRGLPVYRVTCTDAIPANCQRVKPNGAVVGSVSYVTDLGQGLISGNYADIGKFKVPALRGLAARAPFFHNGSKTTLLDVVKHYNEFFSLGLTHGDMADLVAFLEAL